MVSRENPRLILYPTDAHCPWSHSAVIVMPDADLSLAIPSTFFGAVGTAGQRCTTTRRLYLHRSIAPTFLTKLVGMYKTLQPGDPLNSKTLLGPLHTKNATQIYNSAIERLRTSGTEILTGGSSYPPSALSETALHGGNFVQPTLAVPPSELPVTHPIWASETFAPITCVKVFDELEEAIEWNNGVKQGLSSSLWTRDVRNAGKWLGPAGSDAGIVNVRLKGPCRSRSSNQAYTDLLFGIGECWHQRC